MVWGGQSDDDRAQLGDHRVEVVSQQVHRQPRSRCAGKSRARGTSARPRRSGRSRRRRASAPSLRLATIVGELALVLLEPGQVSRDQARLMGRQLERARHPAVVEVRVTRGTTRRAPACPRAGDPVGPPATNSSTAADSIGHGLWPENRVVLRLEVVEERADRDAGLVADRLDRDGVQAVRGDEPMGRVDQRLAARALLALPQAGATGIDRSGSARDATLHAVQVST